ncbi:MAG: hypothetical protein R2769_14305 [Saprospiraceae bacterium]
MVDDIERFSFNTCVSHFMKAVNGQSHELHQPFGFGTIYSFVGSIWHHLLPRKYGIKGYKDSVHKSVYPVLNEDYLKEDNIKYPVAINGKTRTFLTYPADAAKADIEKAVIEAEEVQKWLEGVTIRKSSSYQEG